MGIFGKYPNHRGAATILSKEIETIRVEFDRLAKLGKVEDKRIQGVLQELRELLDMFRRSGTSGNSRLTVEQLEQEYHWVLPRIINALLAVDADLRREISFCFDCGDKVAKDAVVCPSCGIRLRG